MIGIRAFYLAMFIGLLAGCSSTASSRHSVRLDPGDPRVASAPPGSGRRFVLREDEYDREVTPPVQADEEVLPAPSVETHDAPTPPAHEHLHPGATSESQPKAIVKQAPKPGGAGSRPVIYACPMHPEVTDTKPSKCPKCGMTLVRKTPK